MLKIEYNIYQIEIPLGSMKIIKYLETRLNINDTNSMFCSDYDSMLLNLLKDRFAGRCYKSVFIQEIIEIVRRGNINCKSKSLDGGLYVDVQFKAHCLIYEIGEIIHRCRIVAISNDNIIVAETDACALKIRNVLKLDIFKVGDEISVTIERVMYNIFDKKVAMSAFPLVPLPKVIVKFRIMDNVFEEDKTEMESIHSLEQSIKAHDAKTTKFFRDLLYPRRQYYNYADVGKSMKLDEYSRIGTGDIVFIGDRYLNEDIFYKCNDTENAGAHIEISKQEMYYKILLDYKKSLGNLLGFLENYSIELVKKNATLWKVYSSLKAHN